MIVKHQPYNNLHYMSFGRGAVDIVRVESLPLPVSATGQLRNFIFQPPRYATLSETKIVIVTYDDMHGAAELKKDGTNGRTETIQGEGHMKITTRQIIVPVLIIIGLLAGCVSVSKTYTAEGKEGYVLKCPGSGGSCFEKAGEICGVKGYEVIKRFPMVNGILNSTMIIKCKE